MLKEEPLVGRAAKRGGQFHDGNFSKATACGAPTPTGADVSTVVTGLFYGGGIGTLKAQFIGSAVVTAATFVAAMGLMYAVKATGTLRVSPEGELEGLDVHEHGSSAYPEYMISGSESVILTLTAKDDAA